MRATALGANPPPPPQAASANAYYVSAKEPVVVFIIITVTFAIIYYVSVVIVEVSLLASQSARKQFLEAAVRRATLSRSKSAKGGLITTKDPTKGSFDPGFITSSVNPNFMRVAEATGTLAASFAAAVSTKEPPLPEMWSKFQGSMADLLYIVHESHAQLSVLKAVAAAAAKLDAAGVRSNVLKSSAKHAGQNAMRPKREFGAKTQPTSHGSPLSFSALSSTPAATFSAIAESECEISGFNPLMLSASSKAVGAARPAAAAGSGTGPSSPAAHLASLSVFSKSPPRKTGMSAVASSALGGRGLSPTRAVNPLSPSFYRDSGDENNDDGVNISSPLYVASPMNEKETDMEKPTTKQTNVATSAFAGLSGYASSGAGIGGRGHATAAARMAVLTSTADDDEDVSSFSNPLSSSKADDKDEGGGAQPAISSHKGAVSKRLVMKGAAMAVRSTTGTTSDDDADFGDVNPLGKR